MSLKDEQKEKLEESIRKPTVIDQSALRSILVAIATARNYEIITFDVKIFLYGELGDIYMYPEGYNYKNKILKLKKTLYGLKRLWDGTWDLQIFLRIWVLNH